MNEQAVSARLREADEDAPITAGVDRLADEEAVAERLHTTDDDS